jgi:hypothetical protein
MTIEETIVYLSLCAEEAKSKDWGSGIKFAIEFIKDTILKSNIGKWIPVSDRLPASDDDVLVTNGIGMYIGWIDPTDKRWRVDSESEYFMENIIAWMPLPEPYKTESEDT